LHGRARGFCKVFPAKTGISELKQFNPNGYFIANGPGDPSAMSYAVATVKDILKREQTCFWHLPGSSIACPCQ